MKYTRINGSIKKYDETTHDYVEIVNDIIIGGGETLIEKTDDKYVCWDKFDKPESLKGYGEYAVRTSFLEDVSNYKLSDGTNDLYYDDVENEITTSDTGVRAVIDGSSEEMIEANLQTSGLAILKDITTAVSCGEVDPQSVIDKGLLDQKFLDNQKGGALCLIHSHTPEQDLAVFNLIKDDDLTGANFSSIVVKVVGV